MDTRTIFKRLGFREDQEALTDEPPAYLYDFGNLILSAVQVAGHRSFRPVFLIGGVIRETRSLKSVNFELPLSVDSFEQGVALIAHAIGPEFQPHVPAPWLSEGRRWHDQLPWKRGKS